MAQYKIDCVYTGDDEFEIKHIVDSYYVIDNKITRWNSSERVEQY